MMLISKCCKSDVDVLNTKKFKVGNTNQIYMCNDCDQYCDVEEVCEYCLGDGTLDADETDSDGNTARGVLTVKCHCQIQDDDYDDYED